MTAAGPDIMNTYRILLLDDDAFILSALRRELLGKPYLGHGGLEIETFTSPAAALERAREPEGYFDVVISDNRMPEMSGIDFLKAFGRIQPDAVRIVLSGYAERTELMHAINDAHIDFFIAKPWHEYDLRFALFQALQHYDIRRENRRLAKLYLEQFGLYQPLKRKDKFQLMIVDDDPHTLKALERELGESYTQGCFGLYRLEPHTFGHPDAALDAAAENKFDLVISDYAMPSINGIEFLRQMKEMQPDTVRILLSGMADADVLIGAVNKSEVSCFIGKPWHDYELRTAIDRALAQREMGLENRILADLLRLNTKR